jgi:hypothetical protein
VPRQSRAGLDARYGRQGGRVVPWQPVEPRWRVGDVVRLVDLGDDRLTVVEARADGRLVVRFASGAELIVQPEHLERAHT